MHTHIYKCIWFIVLFAMSHTSFAAFDKQVLQTQSTCTDVSQVNIHCGQTPSVVIDGLGVFHAVFEKDGHVYYTKSINNAKGYTVPVKINKTAQNIYHNGENRPKIVLGSSSGLGHILSYNLDDGSGQSGEIYVSWSKKTEGRFNGDIQFTRSLDQGKTFEEVRTINDDGLLTGHRFDSLVVDKQGHIYIAWLDKRDKVFAAQRNKAYKGAAVYYTISTDKGKTFRKNSRLVDNSCECCRIGSSAQAKQGVTFFWRHIFNGGIRDHGIADIDINTKHSNAVVKRASEDQWKINACPHHGPDIVTDKNNGKHLTWFSNGAVNQGVMYGYFNPQTQTTQRLFSVDGQANASHPSIANNGENIWIVWKKAQKTHTELRIIESHNNGMSWSNYRVLAKTTQTSDHPLFVFNHNSMWISWKTQSQLKLVEVKSTAPSIKANSAGQSKLKKMDLKVFSSTSLAQLEQSFMHTQSSKKSQNSHVVMFWSIDCPPCMQDLAILQDMQTRYGTLPVTLVSTDGMAEPAHVSDMLKGFKLNSNPQWVFSQEDPSLIRQNIDAQWYGELPRQYVYKNGQRKAISGTFSREDLKNWLDLK